MSKKTHRKAEIKEQEKSRRSAEGANRPPIRANKAAVKPAAGKASPGGARVFDRPAAVKPAANALSVRITGAVIALAAILGGLIWALNAGGNYTPGMLAGLVGLGVLAGLGLFTAVRASEVASRMKAQRRK